MNKLLITTALAVIAILGVSEPVKAESEQSTNKVQQNENIQTVHYKKGKHYHHHRHHGHHRHYRHRYVPGPQILFPIIRPAPQYYIAPQYPTYYWW